MGLDTGRYPQTWLSKASVHGPAARIALGWAAEVAVVHLFVEVA